MHRYQISFFALGTDVWLTIVTDKNEIYADWLLVQLKTKIKDFEGQFSRFLSGSELTAFNLKAGSKVSISKPFWEMLVISKRLSKETRGLYNPFVLPSLQQAGYKGSWPTPDSAKPKTNFQDRSLTSIQSLIIGDTWARIPAHAAIDFGGIGKGYLLDKLSQYLSKQSLSGYWLSLGGDIICQGRDIDSHGWTIAVQNAFDGLKTAGAISNSDGQLLAVATSGTTKRKGINLGVPWNHIIDPRTSKPAESDILTATVSADTATIADVYAKAILIAGSKGAKRLSTSNHAVKNIILQLKSGEIA